MNLQSAISLYACAESIFRRMLLLISPFHKVCTSNNTSPSLTFALGQPAHAHIRAGSPAGSSHHGKKSIQDRGLRCPRVRGRSKGRIRRAQAAATYPSDGLLPRVWWQEACLQTLSEKLSSFSTEYLKVLLFKNLHFCRVYYHCN